MEKKKNLLSNILQLGTTSEEELTEKYTTEVANMLTRVYTYKEQSELMIQLKKKLIEHKEKQISANEELLEDMKKDLENFKNNC